MKKRVLRLLAAFLFLMTFIPACDLFENCGTCELVTYLNGSEVSRTAPVPYCGDEYDEKKNDPGTFVGNNWVIWECE